MITRIESSISTAWHYMLLIPAGALCICLILASCVLGGSMYLAKK